MCLVAYVALRLHFHWVLCRSDTWPPLNYSWCQFKLIKFIVCFRMTPPQVSLPCKNTFLSDSCFLNNSEIITRSLHFWMVRYFSFPFSFLTMLTPLSPRFTCTLVGWTFPEPGVNFDFGQRWSCRIFLFSLVQGYLVFCFVRTLGGGFLSGTCTWGGHVPLFDEGGGGVSSILKSHPSKFKLFFFHSILFFLPVLTFLTRCPVWWGARKLTGTIFKKRWFAIKYWIGILILNDIFLNLDSIRKDSVKKEYLSYESFLLRFLSIIHGRHSKPLPPLLLTPLTHFGRRS